MTSALISIALKTAAESVVCHDELRSTEWSGGSRLATASHDSWSLQGKGRVGSNTEYFFLI